MRTKTLAFAGLVSTLTSLLVLNITWNCEWRRCDLFQVLFKEELMTLPSWLNWDARNRSETSDWPTIENGDFPVDCDFHESRVLARYDWDVWVRGNKFVFWNLKSLVVIEVLSTKGAKARSLPAPWPICATRITTRWLQNCNVAILDRMPAICQWVAVRVCVNRCLLDW